MTRTAVLFACCFVALTPALAADEHVAIAADAVKWNPGPPFLAKGAQVSVLTGDPSKEGPYVIRLKFPTGFKVPAHFHPNDENITVISGIFGFGMGDKLDESKGTTLKAGGFARAPKGMKHFAYSTEETVIQIHAVGPAGITYVNPADDPRKSN
jgi:quercetin dioxygenase-like cupin family protein